MKCSETYAMYRGHGKLAVLFLAAVICMIFIYKEKRGRINPLLFVVSIRTGIADAFVSLIGKVSGIMKLPAILFLIFALTLSGGLIWSYDFTADTDIVKTKETELRSAAEYISSLEESPKVLAEYDVMSSLVAYSSGIEPMYELDSSSRVDSLGTRERKLYDAVSDLHPPMDQITRLAHDEGHFYVVLDRSSAWPEKVAEGMYSLNNSFGAIEIYEYGGNVYE